METFNELLEAQLLELGVFDRLKARMGDNHATGKLNLAAEEKEVARLFQVYCGEQGIKATDATLDDFAEFCKFRLNFTIPDEQMSKLIYRTDAQPTQGAQVEALTQQLLHALDTNGDSKTPMHALAQMAQGTDGNAVAAHRALWKITRDHPSYMPLFHDVRQFVGKPIDGRLPQLIKTIAMMTLKYGKKGNAAVAGTPAAGNAAQAAAAGADTLDVGDAPFIDPIKLRHEGWRNATLDAELQKCQSSSKQAKKWIETVGGWSIEDAKKGAKQIEKSMTRDRMINLARVLLQCYRGGNLQYLKNFTDHFHGDGSFPAELGKLLMANPKMQIVNGQQVETYDATAFNKLIAHNIRTQEGGAHMLEVLLHSMATNNVVT
jgi:hypothetical protein